MFRPPDDLIVLEAEHWLVNQGVDVPIPGYLIVGARDPEATRIAALPEAAAAELGPLLVRVHRAIEAVLDPKIVYCVKWGHGEGHSMHFHVIPVEPWLEEALRREEEFRVLGDLHAPPGWPFPEDYDGTEMCLFVRRVFAERADPPPVPGPKLEEVVRRLRERLAD